MYSDSGDVSFQVTCDPVPLEKVPYYDQFIPSSFQIANFDTSTVSNELVVSISSDKDYTTEAGGIVEPQVNLQSQPLTQVIYAVSIDDGTEAVVEEPSVLTFTRDNTLVPRTVRIRGLEDYDTADVNFYVHFQLIPLPDEVPYFDYFGEFSNYTWGTPITNYDSLSVNNRLILEIPTIIPQQPSCLLR